LFKSQGIGAYPILLNVDHGIGTMQDGYDESTLKKEPFPLLGGTYEIFI
jgi:hypothetical protein